MLMELLYTYSVMLERLRCHIPKLQSALDVDGTAVCAR